MTALSTGAVAGSGEGLLKDAYAKAAWRLVPFLFLCYLAAYFDRVNVGFAQLQMRDELGFTPYMYGLGAGIFFIGYFLFEVPSNLIMTRIGARLTLLRIMVLWGITSSATMLVSEPWMFYVLRFLLGMFEAGFAPGVILYFTYWFPARMRARILAFFLTAVAVAGLVGGPVAGGIMSGLHGALGLSGWQWMFLIGGVPSVLLGLLVFIVLCDRPAEASWLTAAEKAAIAADLEQENRGHGAQHKDFRKALRDWRLYALALVYFSITAGVYLISFWLPTILADLGAFPTWQIGLLSALPNGAAAAFMIWLGLHSDSRGERRWHCAISGFVGSLALLATIWSPNVAVSIALFSIATAGIFAMMPVFWAIPPRFFTGTAAAGGIAVINSIGTLSGFVSPSIVGALKSWSGSLTPGLVVMTVLLWLGIVVLLVAIPSRDEPTAGG